MCSIGAYRSCRQEAERDRDQRLLRLCLCFARSFLYLCLRIFLRRFLITLPTENPASTVEWRPKLSVGGCLSSALRAREHPGRASEHARLDSPEQPIHGVPARQEADRRPAPDAEVREAGDQFVGGGSAPPVA